jgi:DNA polymerase III delta prime subunit
MSYFLRSGINWRVTTKESMDLHEQLPVGNYTVEQDEYGNFFLKQIESFEIPDKLYGNIVKYTNRIINSFWDRPFQTGVLLNGEKGSGKTLLAKNISVELAKQNVPTIVINRDWVGDGFFKLLQDIEQPCIVMFDEFEKVYKLEQQEHILTLLDGVFASKKLYILTVNDKWRIDQHMRNRPGRIFYMIDFKGLSREFIREYAQDKLINQDYIEQLCNITSVFSDFNFDMLKALVEEMNRYNESPVEALEMLNIKVEHDNSAKYRITLYKNGKIVPDNKLDTDIFVGNPLNNSAIEIWHYDGNDDDDDNRYVNVKFGSESLVKFDNKQGQFIFEDKGVRLVLTRINQINTFDYSIFI